MNQNVDKLTKDARDIIQAVFDYNVPVACGIPPDAIEVHLDNPVHNLLGGNGTVHFFALDNTEHYLHHCGDTDWAIIFSGSRIGDAEKGKSLINANETIIP